MNGSRDKGTTSTEYKRRIGGVTVTANVEASLEAEATWLLARIAQFVVYDGGNLTDGGKIRMGWSALTLHKRNARFVVAEPDFDSDPFEGTVDDVSRTLRVLFRQKAFSERVGSPKGKEPMFSDKIVLAKGILGVERIAVYRQELMPYDSGWYIGPTLDPGSVTDYEAIYVFNLLKLRPAVLDVLALPEGFMVLFSGDTIDQVFDPNGVDVWD